VKPSASSTTRTDRARSSSRKRLVDARALVLAESRRDLDAMLDRRERTGVAMIWECVWTSDVRRAVRSS
jgi:hypothetical protein